MRRVVVRSICTLPLTISCYSQASDLDDQLSSTIMIKPVEVTAQKRSESLVDVPISMSVIDNNAIENNHAHSLTEIQQLIPNFSISSPAGDPTITIRGVGGGGRNIGFDTRVGVYLDGVYLGQSQALNQPLFDIERVEVLRGPQGYLFGRNSDAGAVNIITKSPSDKFEGYYKTNFARYGSYENVVSVSGPLSDSVQAKLGASYETRDGFSENLFNGDKLDGINRFSTRGQLSFQPNDKLDIDIAADYTNIKQNNLYAETTSAMFGVPFTGAALPAYTINQDLSPNVMNRYAGISVNANYDFDGGNKLTSITAYRTTHQQRIIDDDLTSVSLFNVDFKDNFYQTSQEFRITSPSKDSFRYIAGVYLLHEKAQSDRKAVIGQDANSLVNFPALGLVPFSGLFGVTAGAVIPVSGTINTNSYALFGSADYDLTHQITLNVGGRFTFEQKDLLFNLDGSQSGNLGIATLLNYQDSFSDNNFSPTVGISYHLNQFTNFYAKYASGFKSGGWNVDFLTPTQIARDIKFNKETVNSYEIGLKGTSPNQRIQYDAAVFLSDYQDYQVFQLVKVGTQNELQLRNAAQAQSKGIEASINDLITDHLKMGLSVGFLDARFKSFPSGLAAGVDAAGQHLPDAPNFSASINATYSIPANRLDGRFEMYVENSYRTASSSGVSIDPTIFAVDSRNVVNARLSYVNNQHHLQFSLFATNLLREDYILARARDFLGTGVIKRGEPQSIGLQARYDF